MTQVRAIETVYNGYRFRSRLEARWAVFFDTLGVPYEYEKEGYDLGGGVRYLSDFWLPEQRCWVEIKGEDSVVAHEKAERLAEMTGALVFVFVGSISLQPTTPIACEHGVASWSSDCGTFFEWCECPFCHRVGIAKAGDASYLPCGCFAREAPGLVGSGEDAWYCGADEDFREYFLERVLRVRWTSDTPRIVAAFTAAIQARFEHGETPVSVRH